MPFLRALLVDDEPHCLQALANLLTKNFPRIQIVANCTDGGVALQKIDALRPDLVFLDIEMPAPNGLEIMERIRKLPAMQVIFTTAHSQYAVQAFRTAALDFLLKPISEEDLLVALERAEHRLGVEQRARQFDLLFEAVHLGKQSKRVEKIALPFSDGLEIVPLSQICFLVAEEGYTQFHLADGRKLLVSRKIGEYDDALDGETFLRIHRSHIVNLNYVKKYQRGEGGQVQMSGGQWLDVSRAKKEELLEWLKI